MKLKVGTPAPLFDAPAFGTGYKVGDTINLKDLRGQKVVLVFYPMDNTPG